MILLIRRAGRGLRALSRFSFPLILALAVAACGSDPGDAGPSAGSDPVPGGGDGAVTPGGGGSGPGPAGRVLPTAVGDIKLQLVAFDPADGLDAAGGADLVEMLDALDLDVAAVSLSIAIDPHGGLAIGWWDVPDRDSGAIMAAWLGAAEGWEEATLAGEAGATGMGPDGDPAWAVARDGAFVYIAADQRSLAEAVLLATR